MWTVVTAHGLKGDGATDNSAALTALLAAPPSPAIYFPTGVYVFKSSVTITATSAAGLFLFGLHCWDVVLTLADNTPGFMDPAAMRALFTVPPGNAGPVWLSGLNIRTGFSFGNAQPAPVPAGWTNPNPGTIGEARE